MKAATAEINTQALKNNIDIIKTYVPGSKIVAVVKANAYGHGLYQVASALYEKVDAFAVARLDEALNLREREESRNRLSCWKAFLMKKIFLLSPAQKFTLPSMIWSSLKQLKEQKWKNLYIAG